MARFTMIFIKHIIYLLKTPGDYVMSLEEITPIIKVCNDKALSG